MLVPKKNRNAVYVSLFKEGTLVVKQDVYQPLHSEELPIPNLEVIGLMRSLKSRGFVTGTYNWRYHYYILTNEGIEYLRDYLGLPADVVPATFKKAVAAVEKKQAEEKKAAPGADFNPEFQKKDGYRS